MGLLVPIAFGEQGKTDSDSKQIESSKEASRVLKPVKGVASGVSDVGHGAKELVKQTIQETKSGAPIIGTVEGIGRGSKTLVDSTVKGAAKVATLGYIHPATVEMENPEKQTGGIDPSKGKPSKVKFQF